MLVDTVEVPRIKTFKVHHNIFASIYIKYELKQYYEHEKNLGT